MATPTMDSETASQDRNTDKITLRLSADAREALEWIAAKYGNITLAEAARRALGTERFFLEQKEKGSTILIEETSGRVKEVVFR